MLVKKIAVYGSYEASVPVRQRYWQVRVDGVRQRYWHKTERTKRQVMSGRYEFSGEGKELRQAVAKAVKRPPKGFIDVEAKKFLRDPERYGYEGEWIEREVRS